MKATECCSSVGRTFLALPVLVLMDAPIAIVSGAAILDQARDFEELVDQTMHAHAQTCPFFLFTPPFRVTEET